MNSRDYWRNREAAARKKILEDEVKRSLVVKGIYQDMTAEIEKQVEAFYQRYADAEGLSFVEAQKAVSSLDIKAYEAKAKRYVENSKKPWAHSKIADQEMRIYNLTMKVNRLEMLKAEIGLEMLKQFGEFDHYLEVELAGVAAAEHQRMAGILNDVLRRPENATVLPDASYKYKDFQIAETPFEYRTFSERIWTHYSELKANLDGLLARALVNGEGSGKLAAELRKACDVSEFNARRLMITETARVRIEVQKQLYEENGNAQYQYMALGAEPCGDCADLDGQVFDVADMQPGTNAPPMHPFCHCSTAPYVDREKYNKWLDAIERGEYVDPDYTQYN